MKNGKKVTLCISNFPQNVIYCNFYSTESWLEQNVIEYEKVNDKLKEPNFLVFVIKMYIHFIYKEWLVSLQLLWDKAHNLPLFPRVTYSILFLLVFTLLLTFPSLGYISFPSNMHPLYIPDLQSTLEYNYKNPVISPDITVVKCVWCLQNPWEQESFLSWLFTGDIFRLGKY